MFVMLTIGYPRTVQKKIQTINPYPANVEKMVSS